MMDSYNTNIVKLKSNEVLEAVSSNGRLLDLNKLKRDSKVIIQDYHNKFDIGEYSLDVIDSENEKVELFSSFQIEDAVCYVNDNNFSLHLNWLNNNVKHIYIRIENISRSNVAILLKLLQKFRYETISLELPYTLFHAEESNLFLKEKRIIFISFYDAPRNKMYIKEYRKVNFDTRDLTNIHCGLVAKNNFYLNQTLIKISLSHNSCLFKKISIDTESNIKNCPSMPQSFGRIKDTTLEEVLNHPDFKKYWNINKDKIHVCKDCEFRYICTDCRAYVEDPEDIYSKPLKCGYNPYTGEWSEWSTNPLKQKAIEFYGMQDLVKDAE